MKRKLLIGFGGLLGLLEWRGPHPAGPSDVRNYAWRRLGGSLPSLPMQPGATAIPSSTEAAIDSFLRDPKDDALDALLALEGVRSSNLLARFAAHIEFTEAMFRRILDAGCAVNTSDQMNETPLAQMLAEGSLSASALQGLLHDLLALGADPNLASGHRGLSACDWAVMRTTTEHDLVGMFLPRSTPRSRLDMLLSAIQTVPTYRDYADGHAMVDRLLGVVDDVDQHGRQGLTPVHVAASWADVSTLDRIFRRAKTPERGLPAKVDLLVDGLMLVAKKGMNALALVDAVGAAYEKAAPKWKKLPPFSQALRATRIEHLNACRVRLTEAGLS